MADSQPSTTPSALRPALIALGIVVGSVGSAGLTFWHRDYEPGAPIPYATFSPIHEEWWAWHVFGGLANTLMSVTVALAACMLVPRRGAAWATWGAVTTMLGGLLFGAGVAAEGAAMGYAGDPHALSREAGAALLTYMNDHPEPYVIPILPGLILSSLGLVLISVALWRARSVPVWIPAALFATTVIGFAAPISVSWLIGLPQLAAVIAIAWYVWAGREPAPAAPTP